MTILQWENIWIILHVSGGDGMAPDMLKDLMFHLVASESASCGKTFPQACCF